VKFDTAVPAGLAAYVLVQFLIVLGGATALLFLQGDLDLGPRVAGAVAILITLVSLGGLLERKRWAFGLEIARVLVLALAAVSVLS
jgi:hypothetical protein